MKLLFVLSFCLTQIVYSQLNPITEYDLFSDCPKYYTNSDILSSVVFFDRLVILDSTLYTIQPRLITDIYNITRGLKLNRSELHIGFQGNIYLQCDIDSNGLVKNTKFLRNENYSFIEKLDSLIKLLVFNPAKIEKNNVPSTIGLVFKFALIHNPDKPKENITEIILQYGHCNPIAKRITFSSNLDAVYEENTNTCGQYIIEGENVSILRKGKISSDAFRRLSYFILSQCFLKWNSFFGEPMLHSSEKTVSIKIDNEYHSVSVIGSEYPIGFWAIENLIWKIYSESKLEVIK
ncbi:MAG: hypothetical protein WAR59_08860 [Ignavibacteriaceae bacterium]